MPIFTFICDHCGEFDYIEPSPSKFFLEKGIDLYDDTAIIQCVSCESESRKSTDIGLTSFKLNGTGWYSTDYK